MTMNDQQWVLGLDLSTQSLKGLGLRCLDGRVLGEISIHFASLSDLFPGTEHGIRIHSDGLTVTTPTLLWVEAIDRLLALLASDDRFDLASLKGISGCGQQHGSVYWKKGAADTLSTLDPSMSLRDALQNAFAIQESPIWMDSSTASQVQTLEKCVGGAQELANLTGSAGIERFTGAQILKMAQNRSEEFTLTERISLVSSFVPSILIQKYAPIDSSDGSGMNLLDIKTKEWDSRLLHRVGVGERLGHRVVNGHDVLGQIGPYFTQKYGISKDCLVTAFTGDNPASLSSIHLEPGQVMLSLGTSDTLFFSVLNPVPNTFSHVLCHPNDPESYMAMVVYKNGSLTRESIRNEFCIGSWDEFNQSLKNTPVGCNGQIGIFLSVHEISPRIPAGRYVFVKTDDGSWSRSSGPLKPMSFHPRALIESHFMAMYRHVCKLGSHPKEILVTGGASSNDAMMQIIADIFGVPVRRAHSNPNSAALGGAYRALSCIVKKELKSVIPAQETVLVASPDLKSHRVYEELASVVESQHKSLVVGS